MDDKELVGGKLGDVGKFDISFKEGALVAEIDANVAVGSAGIVVKLDAGHVLDALAKAIPGTIDDSIIAVMKAALGLK